MKKALLLISMALFIGMPIFMWSRTLTGGLPWPVYIYDAARLFALTGFVLLVFQYVLSSRIKWIEKGIGLDRLFGIHRVCGGLILALITAHPLLILLSERLQGYAAPIGFLKVLGLIALVLVWVTAGAALLYGRIPMAYERWKGIHRVGYLILPLAFTHSFLMGSTLYRGPMKGFWVILALIYVAVVVNKIRQHTVLRRHPLWVSNVTQEADDIWRLDFERDHPDYSPGQFMFVRLEREGRISASHPFTIASSPTQKGLSICAKAVGDFTSGLRNAKSSDPAYVDMPYGVFSFVYHNADRMIFIAGGIGITPFLSMLRYMKDRDLSKEVILLWGNKTEKDIAFRAELDRMASEMPHLKVRYILSRQKDWPGEKGRIDREMLKKHVGDLTKGEYFICGPRPMMEDVGKALSGLGIPRRRIHTERFALR
jgi:predicted ferric reductase